MPIGSWIYQLSASTLTAALALGMALLAWCGLRIGCRRPDPSADNGAVVTGIFLLLGLLLAFTFGMAGARYDIHRELIVHEANAIATAVLRAEMYPEPDRSGFRQELSQYLEARIDDKQAGFESPARQRAERLRERAQRAVWRRAAELSRDPRNLAASNQMMPALNEMFDIATARLAAERGHVPEVIIALMFLACLLGTFYAAYFAGRAAHFDWISMLGFGTLISAVVFVALDLERPRRGLIDMRRTYESMLEVRTLLK